MKLLYTSLLLIVLSFFIKKHNLESSSFFVTNIYGQVIKQQSLPVIFDFDQSVPRDKFSHFEKAVSSLNIQLGVEAIRLSYKITSNTSFNNREKDQQNTIYWGNYSNNFLALENPSEQGRASVFWIGDKIMESDIRFNPFSHNDFINIDLDTLIKHELLHTLGFKHNDEYSNILNTYLPANTKKEPLDKNYINAFLTAYSSTIVKEKVLSSLSE